MSTLFDLTGKRAVVTGGASGIGLAMAEALLRAGAQVSIWGRSSSRLDDARSALVDRGLRVATQQVDVSVEDEVITGMTDAGELLGGIDTLVVNAGIGAPVVPFLRSSTSDYRQVLATNLDGAYWTLREGARAMVDPADGSPGGSIIAISSLAAIEGAGRNQAYAATKAGLLAIANASAVELARHGVRVNTILPGWVATDMSAESQASAAFTANVISRIPLRRWGQPEDFAGIVVYLASDASRYQTGSSIVVDGGYSVF
jgi:NAD(P)-dependent dehydrogenase (short-subunit alcohol dehydrogenase family)